MLRALIVLAVVSSCAPNAPSLPSTQAPRSAADVHAVRPGSSTEDADGGDRAARPRSHASRLAPPFGNASGVRRVAPASDAAPESTREIVARAAGRD